MPQPQDDWQVLGSGGSLNDWQPLGQEDDSYLNQWENAWINKPLWEAPARWGRDFAESVDEQTRRNAAFGLNEEDIGFGGNPWIRGAVGGAAQGLGNVISGLTTPLNIATLGLFKGAGSLGTTARTLAEAGEFARAGRALSGARTATRAGKVLSAPVAASGLAKIGGEFTGDDDIDWANVGFGAAEAAGGIVGMKAKLPQISRNMRIPTYEQSTPIYEQPRQLPGVIEGEVIPPRDATPPPPPPDVGGGFPEIVTIEFPDMVTVKMWKDRGYVWVPGSSPMKLVRPDVADKYDPNQAPPPVEPPARPINRPEMPGPIPEGHFEAGDVVPIPNEKANNPTFLAGMLENYSIVEKGPTHTLFRRLIREDEGTFDPEQMWLNLKRLLGRDPNVDELDAAMNRQKAPGETGGLVANFPTARTADFRESIKLQNETDPRRAKDSLLYWSDAVKRATNRDEASLAAHMETVARQRLDQLMGVSKPFPTPEEQAANQIPWEGPDPTGGAWGQEPLTSQEKLLIEGLVDQFGPKPEIPPLDKWDVDIPPSDIGGTGEAMNRVPMDPRMRGRIEQVGLEYPGTRSWDLTGRAPVEQGQLFPTLVHETPTRQRQIAEMAEYEQKIAEILRPFSEPQQQSMIPDFQDAEIAAWMQGQDTMIGDFRKNFGGIFKRFLLDESGSFDPEFWKRPKRLPPRGDEEIPELAFQPDEGVASQRDFSKHFLPDAEEPSRVSNPITMKEINQETQIAPEGRMNEIIQSYPSIYDEALAIYKETNPEQIVKNLARYVVEAKDAFTKMNEAQSIRLKFNIPEPPEIVAAYNKTFRLRALAQAKYERAATRQLEGKQEGIGKFLGDFWKDESGEFDPDALWNNLRRLLGRDPTEKELIEGMQRQAKIGGWDVFEHPSGRTLASFETETEALAFIDSQPNSGNLDYTRHDPNFDPSKEPEQGLQSTDAEIKRPLEIPPVTGPISEAHANVIRQIIMYENVLRRPDLDPAQRVEYTKVLADLKDELAGLPPLDPNEQGTPRQRSDEDLGIYGDSAREQAEGRRFEEGILDQPIADKFLPPEPPKKSSLVKSDPMATNYIENIQIMGPQKDFNLNSMVVEAQSLILKSMERDLTPSETRRFHNLADMIENDPKLPKEIQQSFKFDQYQLPDGTVVNVDATASKGQPEIDFGMKGGKTVKAVRLIRRFFGEEQGATPYEDISEAWKKVKGATGWGQGATKGGVQSPQEFNWIKEAMAVPRNATTTLDASYPGRQGLAQIATLEFWKGIYNMGKAISPAGMKQVNRELMKNEIMRRPIDPDTGKELPSFAEKNMGIHLNLPASHEKATTTKRMEAVASKWLETGGSIPYLSATYRHSPIGYGVRATNRMFLTMHNYLKINRAQKLVDTMRNMSIRGIDTGRTAMPGLLGGMQFRSGENLGFTQKVTESEALDLNPYHNLVLARELGDFVNTATGQAPLKTHGLPLKQAEINLEPVGNLLRNTLFSPGLFFSRLRLLNPNTYMMASPYVRKQYLHALLSVGAGWFIATELIKNGLGDDAEVGNVPTSADFGKVRIGDTRFDAGGGFLQFLTTYARLYEGGSTSSSTGQFHRFGSGYQATTQEDMMERFMVNKLDPVYKFIYDLYSASEYNPFHVGDRMLQMITPLMIQDLFGIVKEDPDLLPWMVPVAGGVGTQTYGQGESVGKLIDPENDWLTTGGGLKDLAPWNWNSAPGERRTFPWSEPD